MTSRKIILYELNEISAVVANIAVDNVYQLPQGYFENFSANMLLKVKELDAAESLDETNLLSPMLSALKNTFTVPDGYFAGLPEEITIGANAIEFVNEELENLSPVMLSVKSSNVYTLPQGYFDSLPSNMLQIAKAQTPAKVVSISFAKKIRRYAAAAAIAGIITISGWWYVQHSAATTKSNGAAAKVEQEIKTFNDEEIEQYINNTQTNYNSVAIITNAEEMSTDNIKDMIADIPDDELQQYLEEHNNLKESFN
jgi:hypothetical protein